MRSVPLRNSVRLLPIVLVAVLLVACSSSAEANLTPTAEAAPVADVTLVLGDISDDPGEVIEGTQPLADYLAAQLAPQGITRGEVRIATSAEEMTRLLQTGEVDLYFDSVYPATLISDSIDAEIILRRWRFGVEEYYSVIFAKESSNIDTLADLQGKVVAFDTPYSTSGYFLPVITLLDNGFTVVGRQSPLGENEIGLVFSYDDENTIQWVLSDIVAAGATDDFNYYNLIPDDIRSQLVVLTETIRVPRQVAVARPGMDPALMQAIIDALVNADEDPAAAEALDAFQTSQFDIFPEGIEAAQENMRALMERVGAIQLP